MFNREKTMQQYTNSLKVEGVDGVFRSLDEHYGAVSEVAQDLTGALWAIQALAQRVEFLEEQRRLLAQDKIDLRGRLARYESES